LESFTCPECGSDFREVGITTPALRRGPGPVTWAVLWTLFLPSPALWMSGLVTDKLMPTPVVTQIGRTVSVVDPSGVPSKSIYPPLRHRGVETSRPGFRSLSLKAIGRGIQWGQAGPPTPVPVTDLTLTLDMLRPGGISPLAVDLASGAWHYTDATGRTVSGGGPFVPAVVVQYLGDAGFDKADGELAARASDVHTLAQDLPQARGNYVSLGQDSRRVNSAPAVTTTTPQPIPWAGHAAVVFWEAVWLAVIVWIVRRHRSGKLAAP
jgi:hypothetical protein